MADTEQHRAEPADRSHESVGELVQRASWQTAELMRQEFRLAQLELKDKGRRAGKGAGLIGAASLVAFYGGATLVAAAVLGLATAVEPWLGALVVGIALIAVGGVLALLGKKQATKALPPAPEEAAASLHEDVQHIKERTHR